MYPVPAYGGNLVALFPQNAQGVCMCTPKPDPGTLDNTVIATTTALAYPRGSDIADVCIVRLLISSRLPPDVNQDLVVNASDLLQISNDPFYNPNVTDPSLCPLVGIRRACGINDVNGDGKINQLDLTSVVQSLFMGSNVTCGGVYATAFSCGSSRQAPLTPAVEISLDSIVWFNDDGVDGATNPLVNMPGKRSMQSRSQDYSLFQSILGHVEAMESKNVMLEAKITQLEAKDIQLEAKDIQHDAKDAEHDQGLVKKSGREVVLDVFVSLGVLLAAALLSILVIRRK